MYIPGIQVLHLNDPFNMETPSPQPNILEQVSAEDCSIPRIVLKIFILNAYIYMRSWGME